MFIAGELCHRFEASLDLLETGAISLAHARVIIDAAMVIGPGEEAEVVRRRAGYEREVLEVAARETPNRLRPVARRLAEKWAERTIEERHVEAAALRRVVVIEGRDGMADLIAHLPAIEAHAIKDRLTRIAQAAERGERIVRVRDFGAEAAEHPTGGAPASRTRDQLRADVLGDLLLSADECSLFAGSTSEAIRARVQFVLTAAPGEETRPRPREVPSEAELLGSGIVSSSAAGECAAASIHWDRVINDPHTGEVLRVDRYRPSEAMRRLLGARDQRCRFPGCRMPVHRCDLDHTIDAALGGPTSSDNLAHLCRGHHTLKHHSDWRVRQEPGGVLRWTSPTGRTYTDQPPGNRALGNSAPRNRASDRSDRADAAKGLSTPGF